MAAQVATDNVIVSSADGDTFSGSQVIQAIKLVGGVGATNTFTIKNGSRVLYSITVGASAEKLDYLGSLALTRSSFTINVAVGSGTIYIYVK